MATIFKRVKGAIDFFSPSTVELPKKKLAALEELRQDFGEETYSDHLSRLMAQADNGDPIENNFENLAAISSRYDLLAPLARDTRAAQMEMAVALLNEKVSDVDAHIEAIKKATGESWPKIRLWCDEPAKGGAGTKKSGRVRVPTDVVRAIDNKVQEAKDDAARRRAKAEANKAAKASAA